VHIAPSVAETRLSMTEKELEAGNKSGSTKMLWLAMGLEEAQYVASVCIGSLSTN
jgi:hypothetical protein